MNAIAASLGGLLLFGGGAVAASGEPLQLSSERQATVSASSQLADGPEASREFGGSEGTKPNGQMRGGGEGRPSRARRGELRRELQERTLRELGITDEEMLEARIAAIESMVEDGLLEQQQADRMIERTRRMAGCRTSGKEPRECMRSAAGPRPGGGHRDGNGRPGYDGAGEAPGDDPAPAFMPAA